MMLLAKYHFLLLLGFVFLSISEECLRQIRSKLNSANFSLSHPFAENELINKKSHHFFLPKHLNGCETSSSAIGVRVFLTVSSLINSNDETPDRNLELNWYNIQPRRGDWIGLYTSDLCAHTMTQPKLLIENLYELDGYYKTDVPFTVPGSPTTTFGRTNLTKMCLNFWIAYVRLDKVLAVDCLKIQPNWMWENKEAIKELSLSELMIPGTHSSGSYRMKDEKTIPPERSIGPYQITQDEDMWHQLVYGIRYFDLNVAFHVATREYWLHSGNFPANPLAPALQQIKEFVASTKEIVILDFHHFSQGFNFHNITISRRHQRMVENIGSMFEQWLIPKKMGYNVILEELWEQDKRVLISYNDENFIHDTYLWPGVAHFGINTDEVEILLTYFEKFQFNVSYNHRPWIAHAHLTPDELLMESYTSGNVGHLAENCNRFVTEWFRDIWWDKANVVATDYFHGNNIVDVAIEINQQRPKNKINTL